jgi:succinate dehydrogenase/fumarate reductase flavoprotein subunit
VHAKALKRAGSRPRVDQDEVRALKEKVFAPLHRAAGITPKEFIPKVQDAVGPVDYSVIKTESRMNEALTKVLDAQKDLPQLKATDLHELARCLDAESMALEAEMFYRASMARTESRGFHLREDYPDRDDANWLKWIIVRKAGDEMMLRTDDIPIGSYPYKPEWSVRNASHDLRT